MSYLYEVNVYCNGNTDVLPRQFYTCQYPPEGLVKGLRDDGHDVTGDLQLVYVDIVPDDTGAVYSGVVFTFFGKTLNGPVVASYLDDALLTFRLG